MDEVKIILEEAEIGMNKSVSHLNIELSKVRAGRAKKPMLDEITKAIINANLGLNPQNNGEVIIISVPVLTEERRIDLVRKAKSEGEHAKVSIRSQRKDANDMVKSLKDEGLSEDGIKESEENIQKLTDSFTKKVDELIALKEADIMKV